MQQPDFTLTAGPVMAWPQVLAAQSAPIIYHYDPAFLEAFRRTERKLGEIYRTSKDILLMQGEAVLGLEAAARGLVRPGTACLNLVSGHLRLLHGLLAARLRRRAARDRGAVQRRHRPGRGRALPRRSIPRSRSSASSTRRRRPARSTRRRGPRARSQGARRADARRLRLVARRHAAVARRVAARRLRRRRPEVPRRPSRHVAHERERRGLGSASAPTRPRRAARSCRCSTGRSSGSTASKFPFTPVGRRPLRRRGGLRASC